VVDPCACLTMNGVGEPCAGEPHARFDRGPLADAEPVLVEMGDKAASPAPDTRYTNAKPAAYLTARNLAVGDGTS
jgi:hypothetical protein